MQLTVMPAHTFLSLAFALSLYLVPRTAAQVNPPDQARLQPWPLHVQNAGACCRLLADFDAEAAAHPEGPADAAVQSVPPLAKCFADSAAARHPLSALSGSPSSAPPAVPAAVAVVSYASALPASAGHFATPDIWSFASLHVGLAALYCEHNRYQYHLVDRAEARAAHDTAAAAADASAGAAESDADDAGAAAGSVENVDSAGLPSDVRWHKVTLLLHALGTGAEGRGGSAGEGQAGEGEAGAGTGARVGWASPSPWVAWLDSDAAVLDFGLRLELLAGGSGPGAGAHVIASADIRQGYINSGVLVVRSSEFSRRFLLRWWQVGRGGTNTNTSTNSTTRPISSSRPGVWGPLCDQDAFDHAYREWALRPGAFLAATRGAAASASMGGGGSGGGSGGEAWLRGLDRPGREGLVRILPRDALNSDPPATLTLRPGNQVLHLMGESSALRRAALRTALGHACDARSGGVLPVQLGLPRLRLQQLALEVYREETRRWGRALSVPAAGAAAAAGGGAGGEKDGGMSKYEGEGGDWQQRLAFLEGEGSAVSADGTKGGVGLGAGLLGALELHSRASHHLSDLLAALFRAEAEGGAGLEGAADGVGAAAGSGGAGGAELQRILSSRPLAELIDVRRSALSLALQWADRLRLASNSNSNSSNSNSSIDVTRDVAQTAGASGASSGAVLAVLGDRRRVAGLLVGALKRAAEAGNDLFGSLLTVQERRDTADTVFSLLAELEGRLAPESRAVPQHMRALMHQSLGLLDLELAAQAGTEAGTEQGHDPDNGQGQGQGQGQRAAFLSRARGSLEASAALFAALYPLPPPSPALPPGPALSPATPSSTPATTPSNTNPSSGGPDPSSLLEQARTLQLLAAALCHAGLAHAHARAASAGAGSGAGDMEGVGGMERWRQALTLGLLSAGGVAVGPAFAGLQEMYHNAAVCFLQGGAPRGALALADRAVEVGQALGGGGGGDGSGGSDGLLQLSRRLVADLEGRVRGQGQGQGHGQGQLLSDLDEEWEECGEGEDGCVALEVDAAGRVLGGLPPSPAPSPAPSPVLSSVPSPASPTSGSMNGMNGMNGGARASWGVEAAGDEGPLEMEGEDAETMEIRRAYAAQSRRYLQRRSGGSVGAISAMSPPLLDAYHAHTQAQASSSSEGSAKNQPQRQQQSQQQQQEQEEWEEVEAAWGEEEQEARERYRRQVGRAAASGAGASASASAAASAGTGTGTGAGAGETGETREAGGGAGSRDSEIAALRAAMEALRARLDRLEGTRPI